MTEENVVRTIDALRAAEDTSLLQRLGESASFISPHDAKGALALEEMIQNERIHAERLVQLLGELEASPGPRRVMASSADVHYNAIHTVLPRLIADKRRLIAVYEAAAQNVAHSPPAAEVVAANLGGHRQHLEQLEKLNSACPS